MLDWIRVSSGGGRGLKKKYRLFPCNLPMVLLNMVLIFSYPDPGEMMDNLLHKTKVYRKSD